MAWWAVPFDLLAVTAKTPASAAGLVLYETSAAVLVLARGVHRVTAAAYNRDATGALRVGPASLPFSCVAVDDVPAPAAPVIRGVVRG